MSFYPCNFDGLVLPANLRSELSLVDEVDVRTAVLDGVGSIDRERNAFPNLHVFEPWLNW